jgi:hypothetical protein
MALATVRVVLFVYEVIQKIGCHGECYGPYPLLVMCLASVIHSLIVSGTPRKAVNNRR